MYRRGGETGPRNPAMVREIIEAKTRKNEQTGCWEWTGYCSPKGYAKLTWGKDQLGSRVSYRVFRGPIPDGRILCHTCDNPSCVNPDHLFVGTHQDNALDRWAKGREFPHAGERKRRKDASLSDDQVRQV
jgi:hypothetical protein